MPHARTQRQWCAYYPVGDTPRQNISQLLQPLHSTDERVSVGIWFLDCCAVTRYTLSINKLSLAGDTTAYGSASSSSGIHWAIQSFAHCIHRNQREQTTAALYTLS